MFYVYVSIRHFAFGRGGGGGGVSSGKGKGGRAGKLISVINTLPKDKISCLLFDFELITNLSGFV